MDRSPPRSRPTPARRGDAVTLTDRVEQVELLNSGCVSHQAARPLEGIDSTRRVIAIRFESEAAFRTFSDSPEYQAVIGKRLNATNGFVVLVNVN